MSNPKVVQHFCCDACDLRGSMQLYSDADALAAQQKCLEVHNKMRPACRGRLRFPEKWQAAPAGVLADYANSKP